MLKKAVLHQHETLAVFAYLKKFRCLGTLVPCLIVMLHHVKSTCFRARHVAKRWEQPLLLVTSLTWLHHAEQYR